MFVSTTTVNYGRDDVELLTEDLTDQNENTRVIPVSDINQLQLTDDGKTEADGFSFTPIAFRQICSLLSPGLAGLFLDVSGLRGDTSEAPRRYSLPLALTIFNFMLAQRFETDLDSKWMVVDLRDGSIDGIVGKSYQRLSNLEVLNQTARVLDHYQRDVELQTATVIRRRFSVHYTEKQSLIEGEDSFHRGYYFSNSEVGDGAMVGSPSLFRLFNEGRALGYAGRKGRLNHTGKDFQPRLESLIDRVIESSLKPDTAEEWILRTQNTSLGFTDDLDANDKRFESLKQLFIAKRISAGLAQRVLRNAVLQGSFEVSALPSMRLVPENIWYTRTEYDLVNSMLRCSQTLPVLQREQIEQLAFAVLSGRMQLNEE